jgi:hypothetical protein
LAVTPVAADTGAGCPRPVAAAIGPVVPATIISAPQLIAMPVSARRR